MFFICKSMFLTSMAQTVECERSSSSLNFSLFDWICTHRYHYFFASVAGPLRLAQSVQHNAERASDLADGRTQRPHVFSRHVCCPGSAESRQHRRMYYA